MLIRPPSNQIGPTLQHFRYDPETQSAAETILVTKALAWLDVSFWKNGMPKWKEGRDGEAPEKRKNNGCYG